MYKITIKIEKEDDKKLSGCYWEKKGETSSVLEDFMLQNTREDEEIREAIIVRLLGALVKFVKDKEVK